MKHFTYKSLQELASEAERIGAQHVRFEPDPEKVRSILARPVMVGGFRVGNAIAIHPMEGCDGDPDGKPGELTWRRYDRYGRSGAKLLWFEATAVRQDGRANPRQLWIHSGTVSEMTRLLEHTRQVHRETYGTADDLLEVLQLTHSGRQSVPRKIVPSHNPCVDAKTGVPDDYPLVSDDVLERIEDDFVAAARLACRAGFRAIDIKATHGYLAVELLGARNRPGRYGGPLENRLRFLRNVLGKIRGALGDRLMLCVRLGCYDGVPYYLDPATGGGVPCRYEIPYPHGFGVDPCDPLREDLTEVKRVIEQLRGWRVALLNVSAGSPYYNPHIGRPFEKPDEGNYEQPEHPLLGVDRHFRIAGELQQTFPELPLVGTGYSWLQKYSIHAGAANIAASRIRFFGLGRGSLAHPNFPREALERGELDERKVCKTLTFCTFLMRQKNHPLGQFPCGCPPFDKEGYGQIMKEAAAARRTAARMSKGPRPVNGGAA
ncbi:MAG: NADH:flavin oxidoreductase [Acidobacteria bacterium]|nr:NADH:flavin oxidoreductase [Acidobacteriota bacterium]